jgi:hypothetical protein
MMRNVVVRGASRFTPTEIKELAGLNDADVWAIAVPRDLICKALERNPFIESAQVSLAGPLAIAIKISERKPVCAVETNNSRLVFDRTGELMEVLGPREIYLGRIARGVPPGLLRENGAPIHSLSGVWSLTPDLQSGMNYQSMVASLDLQFDRMITLLGYLSAGARDHDSELQCVRMDPLGRISVEYSNLPPILLGRFDDPDPQVRGLLTFLDHPESADPAVFADIDLSNMLFPCMHTKDNSPVSNPAGQTTPDNNDTVVSLEGTSQSGETGDGSQADNWDDESGIFSLDGD